MFQFKQNIGQSNNTVIEKSGLRDEIQSQGLAPVYWTRPRRLHTRRLSST